MPRVYIPPGSGAARPGSGEGRAQPSEGDLWSERHVSRAISITAKCMTITSEGSLSHLQNEDGGQATPQAME